MHKIMDPFLGAGRDEHGSILYTVEDKEIESMHCFNEERLQTEYNNIKGKGEQWEVDEEDTDQFRIALMNELEENNTGFNIADFHNELSKELGVFKEGEKYDFAKDLKDAYKISLKSDTEQKIFNTIPEHYFWDIKTPQDKKPVIRKNRYNPFRGREHDNFFDMRAEEEYIRRNHVKTNVNDSTSIYTRY